MGGREPADPPGATAGTPEARQVQGDDLAMPGELAEHRLPHLPPAADTVDQDQWRTAAAALVSQHPRTPY
ncbi:hypothetical protein GCM10020358_43090 [Amorphoplanes nipponensis]